MKIVQHEDVPRKRGLEHRGGMFHSRILLEGEPGRIDNFQLSLGEMGGDFYSPRHRHNFEQIRFQVAGTLDYARNGKLKAGMVGYFPEGVHYGPQSQDPKDSPMTLVLQCGGASGSGYLSRQEVKAGMDALSDQGEFKDGVFRRKEGAPGKKNVDGYQAIWEYVNGRPMAYPEPRYQTPLFMEPANWPWSPAEGEAGVSEKRLGVFTECGTEAGLLRIEAGAAHRADGRAIYFVVSGVGACGGERLKRFTTVFVERGETATIRAEEETVILRYGLPDLGGLMAAEPTAVAAE